MTTNTTTPDNTDIRIHHNPARWPLPDYTDLADCTSNHIPSTAGQPPCTTPAVWRVVADHGMHLTITFWCDTHLPNEHRQPAA